MLTLGVFQLLVSGGIKSDSFPARILQAIIQDTSVQIALSPSIIDEYRRVSRYSKFAQSVFLPSGWSSH
jgi:predicted nucleic acid-binding protein